jgi:thiol-disulfide isomerase/thioredoxin
MRNPILIFLFCILIGCKDTIRKPIITGMENKPLPTFRILLADSINYFNSSELASDKRLILFYYSYTCPYCRAELREILNNINKLKNVEICIITGGDFQSMKQFGKYFKLKGYSNIVWGMDTKFRIGIIYNISVVPFTAIFDDKKQLVSAFVGRITINDLLRYLRS